MNAPQKSPKYSTRGLNNGPCNLCGHIGKLTDDHVPPKGCPKVSTMRVHQLSELLVHGKLQSAGRQAQGGVKFRTLCGRCNNTLLGREYDPSLIALCSDVDRFLSAMLTGVAIPSHTMFRIKPQRVMRAVIGHMLASAVARVADGPWDGRLAAYFLNQSAHLPSDVQIYYWLYPFKKQVTIRDGVYLSLAAHDRGKEPTYFMALKFYPLAFLIADRKPTSYAFRASELTAYGELDVDGEADITISFRDLLGEHWPEAPTDSHVVLYAGDPMYAKVAR